MRLTDRQRSILTLVESEKTVSMQHVVDVMLEQGFRSTKSTILRDMGELVRMKYLTLEGAGRGARYILSNVYEVIKPINQEDYFSVDVDDREIRETYNFDIATKLQGVFSAAEIEELDALTRHYRGKIKKLSPTILRKERERLTIDFSWKSSKIEGNTYSLLETEQLLRKGQKMKGHTESEAQMILNHKDALDFIHENREKYDNITVREIEQIHALLTNNLGILKGMRQTIVGITGTNYRPLDNQFQIREALELICEVVNTAENIYEKTLIITIMLAYTQAFEDGNKRTSRLCGNAVLEAYEACPFSYRSVDDIAYKRAVLLFYEQNNISLYKEMFIDQYRFAVNEYFG